MARKTEVHSDRERGYVAFGERHPNVGCAIVTVYPYRSDTGLPNFNCPVSYYETASAGLLKSMRREIVRIHDRRVGPA